MNRPLEKTAFKEGSEDPFERRAGFQQRAEAALPQQARARAARSRPTTSVERRDTRALLERRRAAADAAAAAAPSASRAPAR